MLSILFPSRVNPSSVGAQRDTARKCEGISELGAYYRQLLDHLILLWAIPWPRGIHFIELREASDMAEHATALHYVMKVSTEMVCGPLAAQLHL